MAKKITKILEPYSGKIGGLVFQKNGRVRINSQLLVKRRKRRNHVQKD